MLERVKHLFEIDNVVFVIATDTSQLKHAIGAVYGAQFDAEKYLFRFFDRTYVFQELSRVRFVDALINRFPLHENKLSLPPNYTLAQYITGAFDFFGLGARDCEQCLDIFRSAVTVWDARVPLEICALFLLVIGLQQKMYPDFSRVLYDGLKKLAASIHADTKRWQFRFQAFASFDRRFETENINGLELFSKFVSLSELPMQKLFDTRVSKAGDAWVASRLEEEFRTLGQMSISTTSIIREYPALIRSAGRLLPNVVTSK